MRSATVALAGACCCVALLSTTLGAQADAPAGKGEVVLTLPDSALIAEDLAWDGRTSTWYVSSVHQRRIVAIGRDGVPGDFVPPGGSGLWTAYAIALDTARNRLWVTSGATAEGAGNQQEELGRTAVFSFDLKTGQLAGRYELPEEAGVRRVLADLALLDDGTLAVSDSRGGGFYLLDPAARRLVPLVAPGTFRSPQGPAGIPGTHEVLVADYSRGIAKVNLTSGAVAWLEAPADLPMKGIDGIQLSGRTLIVVQNGVQPNRVVRMELDGPALRIVSWKILAAGAPELVEPTHGVLIGGDFVFIANSGWDQVGEDGSLQNPASLRRSVIRRVAIQP